MTATTPAVLSPTHSGAAGNATGELSNWVNRVRSGAGNVNKHPYSRFTDNALAADFQEEVRQSRLDRQRRRNRLSGQGVRGFTGQGKSITPPIPTHAGPDISSAG